MTLICYVKTPFNEGVVDVCSTLKQTFNPLFWARGGVSQTFLQQMIPCGNNRYSREIFAFSDGVETSLDWKYAKNIRTAPIIVCLHGLGGDSGSNYLKIFTNYCQKVGYTTVVYNRRGHGGGSLLPKVGLIENASCVFPQHVNMTDMKEVVDYICKKWPNQQKYLVGFSCGANLAINYLAEVGMSSPFVSSIAVCNGYNILELTKTNKYFNKIATGFLKDMLLARLKECQLIAQKKGFKIDWKAAKRAKSIQDFERCFVESYGHESLESYYEKDSSHNKLHLIKKPILCIQNRSDPFVPESMNCFPAEAAKENPNIFYVETESGGHLGWIENVFKTPWYMKLMIEYFNLQPKG